MEFAPENFPVYQLLVKLNQPGVENLKKDFAAAKDGGDDEKYHFALGLFGLVTAPDIQKYVPGLTDGIVKNTLEQAYAIFEETGNRNHPAGALMTAFAKATGQGTAEDFQGAIKWLDKAETLGGTSEFTQALRQKINEAPGVVYVPKKPGNSPGN